MKKKLLALALCLTLALSLFGSFASDAEAAPGNTVYTFGDTSGPFRDLAKEAEQRKKDKKKASLGSEQEQREKFARMKAQRRK